MGWALACGPSGSRWMWVDDSERPQPSPEVQALRDRRVHILRRNMRDMAERLGMTIPEFSHAENGKTQFTAKQLAAYHAVVEQYQPAPAERGEGE